jgi:homoserine kinase type II
MEFLAAKGIPCPVPLRNKKGEQLFELNGRPAAILTFLNGLSLRRPDAAQCAAVGAALARLHAAGKDFSMSRENSLSIAGWNDLVVATADKADSVQDGLRDLIASSYADLKAHWPHSLPSGVIHADLFPDNVLFMNDDISGVIDFYFACNDAYAYDLAILLNAWCFENDGGFNITKGKSLIAAYRKNRALSPEEISALPLLMRGAALRFLLTRLYDWLNHDPNALVRPKDPRDFSRRLRFHLKVKRAAEYGL